MALKSTIRDFGCIALLMLVLVLNLSAQQAGTEMSTLEGEIPRCDENLMRSTTCRFIENNGQYSSDIRYVAPSNMGWIVFMDDRILFKSADSDRWMDESIQVSQVSKEATISRKLTQVGGIRITNRTSSMSRIVVRVDSAFGSQPATATGLRQERVYFWSAEKLTAAVGAATWDTVVYSDYETELKLLCYYNSDCTISFQLVELSSGTPEAARKVEHLKAQIKNLSDLQRIETVVQSYYVNQPDQLRYSTLIGGSQQDAIVRIHPLNDRKYLLFGITASPDFPTAGSPWDASFNGDTNVAYSMDAYIACLDIEKKELVFSTYFGGHDIETVQAAAVNEDGQLCVAGSTWSDDLPVTKDAWQMKYNGSGDAYIAIFDSTGTSLLYCTYLGGSGVENLKDMKLYPDGSIMITGLTDSNDYPTTEEAFQRSYGGGGDDIFVSVLSRDASMLQSSTYFGGSGWDEGYSIRLNEGVNMLVAGFTNSENYPITADGLYQEKTGYDEGCIFILTRDCRHLLYSTYIAWDMYEGVQDAYLDSSGIMSVFGITSSFNIPVTENAYQKSKGEFPEYKASEFDFYILRYDVNSRMIHACTYLGGSGSERFPEKMQLVPGGILVCGDGWSNDYPLTSGNIPNRTKNLYTPFVSVLSEDLSHLLFSIAIAGDDNNLLNGITFNGGFILVAGTTYSNDYPLTTDAYLKDRKGDSDGVFSILDLSSVLTGIDEKYPVSTAVLIRQNYPNPFVTQTSIPFQLSMPGHVRLQILDMLGREITTLVDGYRLAGLQEAVFTSNGIPSGLYLYRLSMDGNVQSRLMVLEQ
jgi:hypothetical protein